MKNINRDQLLDIYVEEVIDNMDHNDLYAMLHDFIVKSYENYSTSEIIEEVEEYYPHILSEQ